MRIFFGATLSPDLISEIDSMQKVLKGNIPDARLERPEKLHITLHFIGEFPDGAVDELFRKASESLSSVGLVSAETTIVGMNFFPGERIKRGIWLDCVDNGTLEIFAGKLKKDSESYGVIPEERSYRPHITIARLKHYRERKEKPFDLQKFSTETKLIGQRFFPQSVALFESILNPGSAGSQYRILRQLNLARA